MSASWRRPMDAWLSSHLGIIAASKLVELGCSARNVGRMVDRRELVVMLPGVYRSAQWPCNRQQIMAAACARNPAALIGFTTAGQLWGLRKMTDDRLHVLIPHGHSPEIKGLVVHRCRQIDAVDIVERSDGILLTSPPRTLFDSAGMIGESAAASVMEQLLNERRCTFGTITDTVTRLYHPRRPGSTAMLAVIRSRPTWRTALQSGLESLVLEELARQGLPTPTTQFRMRLPDGIDIAIDFAWPRQRVALEVDHPAWHAGAVESHRDKHRDRKLVSIGWSALRLTDIDVAHGLAEAVADVAVVLQARAA
jgi:very-short-patch-repair endonuclease